jgi:hypothetical protein
MPGIGTLSVNDFTRDERPLREMLLLLPLLLRWQN